MARDIHAALGLAQGPEIEAVTTEIDIYRAANLLIKDHGDEAVIEAAMRADAMLEEGDLDGLAVWKRILAAVEELLGRERPEGDLLH